MIAAPVLFLCPFKAEATLLLSILPECKAKNSQHWQFKGGEIITWNGSGPEKMSAAMNSFIGLHNFSRLVLFGSAGALDPDLKPGQIFSASSVKLADRQIKLPCLQGFAAATALTNTRPVFAADERLELFSRSGCQLVDMESFFFVEKFHRSEQQVSVLRFISDTAELTFKLPFAKEIQQQVLHSRKMLLTIMNDS
ncbi:MAG: hypothetical protein PHD82_05685 [Candidatus Riflebacteria bacterium]|nr:hypothetical protein [Candidatus Riflebacteria bacterium]